MLWQKRGLESTRAFRTFAARALRVTTHRTIFLEWLVMGDWSASYALLAEKGEAPSLWAGQ